jgi:hypothetical protein
MIKGFRDAVRIYEVMWRAEGGLPPPPEENTEVRVVKPPHSGGTVAI